MIYNFEIDLGAQGDGRKRDSEKRPLIVPIPKSEPPLEGAFVFPAENGGWKRRDSKRKETNEPVPANRRAAVTII